MAEPPGKPRTGPSATAGDGFDPVRMRRERGARLRASMERHGLDALVSLGSPNVQYAAGLSLAACDSARAHYERPVAVAFRDGAVHAFTASTGSPPDELPEDRRHAPLALEYPEGTRALAAFLRDALGDGAARVGIDEHTATSFAALPDALAPHELVDAGPALGDARIVKTRDELHCIERAQHLNELAMADVLPLVRPGARQCDLSARFLRRIYELGASGNVVDPIWQVVGPRLADNPFSVGGDVPFPCTTTDRMLREDDVLWVDSGVSFRGYGSDFGRTWIASREARPSDPQRRLFERWREVVERVCAAVRPGATGLDLVRAGTRGCARRPWLEHFYLAHGVGLSSAEMPLIGTDLGESFDERIVLEPGMVLVLEPATWEEGFGGYRAEEILAVTETGYRFLSDFPYAPFEGRTG